MNLRNTFLGSGSDSRIWLAIAISLAASTGFLIFEYAAKTPFEGPIESWGFGLASHGQIFGPILLFTAYGAWIGTISLLLFLLIVRETRFIWRRALTIAALNSCLYGAFALKGETLPIKDTVIVSLGNGLYYFCMLAIQYTILIALLQGAISLFRKTSTSS